jgi:hypothetical protein
VAVLQWKKRDKGEKYEDGFTFFLDFTLAFDNRFGICRIYSATAMQHSNMDMRQKNLA